MERVVERGKLLAALTCVKRKGGSPGVDGRTVEALPGYVREQWPQLQEARLAGTYRPPPVKRVEIPKPGGGLRQLGVPTGRDRFLQQALRQGLQPEWDKTVSEGSDGFRPGRSAPKRSHGRSGTGARATAGWWTWIWRSASLGSTTTS